MRNGRAVTYLDKRMIVEQLLEHWECMPDLRLGQLIWNAISHDDKDLYFIEDEALNKHIKKFIDDYTTDDKDETQT